MAQLDEARRERRPEARGEAALLPIQHWFFEQPMPSRSHWNQAVLLQPREWVDRAALEGALGALIAHHEALRLRFEQDAQGEWRQLFSPRRRPGRPASRRDQRRLRTSSMRSSPRPMRRSTSQDGSCAPS